MSALTETHVKCFFMIWADGLCWENTCKELGERGCIPIRAFFKICVRQVLLIWWKALHYHRLKRKSNSTLWSVYHATPESMLKTQDKKSPKVETKSSQRNKTLPKINTKWPQIKKLSEQCGCSCFVSLSAWGSYLGGGAFTCLAHFFKILPWASPYYCLQPGAEQVAHWIFKVLELTKNQNN